VFKKDKVSFVQRIDLGKNKG